MMHLEEVANISSSYLKQHPGEATSDGDTWVLPLSHQLIKDEYQATK